MDFDFDKRGNLKPYKVIEISIEEFRENFVNSFEFVSSRYKIFEKYQMYMIELSKILTRNYYQWIDGSFITTKAEPRDIDLVTIIDYEDYEKNLTKIESELIGGKARNFYQVDAYIIPDYPIGHVKFKFTNSDKLYWQTLFGKTRMNRAKKQYEKGVIQLNFKGNE